MGVLLEMPSNGAVVWEDFPDIVQAQGKANMFVSLTNWTATTIPQVEAGSRVIVNGAMYKFTANETITGLAAVGNSNDVWFKIVPAGATCTVAAVTADASTWSADKGGYYDGNDKYIGGCRKDGAGNYIRKFIIRKYPTDIYGQSSNKKVIEAAEASTNEFYIKRPISAYAITGAAVGGIKIYQAAGWQSVVGANSTTYNLQLNPGLYEIIGGPIAGGVSALYVTGAYQTEVISSGTTGSIIETV